MGHATLGLIVTLTLGLLLSPLASAAQPSPKVYQIGTLWLGFSAPASSSVFFGKALFKAFQQDLHDLGYVEGRNLVFEHRHAPQSDQLHALAAELAGSTWMSSWRRGHPRLWLRCTRPPEFRSCSWPWPIP
jgi:hypothetical protein